MQIKKMCMLALVMGVMAGFSPLSARKRKRNQQTPACDAVVQDVSLQEVESVVPPVAKKPSRFTRRHPNNQEKREDLQDLTGQLQELMVINPVQRTSAGFVRTSDQNRELALELHNLAALLTDAGFTLNMMHIQAKMDEFNEVPGSASSIARECTFHAQQMQKAIADLTKQRDQVVAQKNKKIKELMQQNNKTADVHADTIKQLQEQIKVAQEAILALTGKLNTTLEAKEIAEKQVAQAHDHARAQAQAHALAQARAAAQAESETQPVADQAQPEEQQSEQAAQPDQQQSETSVKTEEAAQTETAQPESATPEAPVKTEETAPAEEPAGQVVSTEVSEAATVTDTATPDWHKEQADATQK